jgi:hypothetical protein
MTGLQVLFVPFPAVWSISGTWSTRVLTPFVRCRSSRRGLSLLDWPHASKSLGEDRDRPVGFVESLK